VTGLSREKLASMRVPHEPDLADEFFAPPWLVRMRLGNATPVEPRRGREFHIKPLVDERLAVNVGRRASLDNVSGRR
jgi:hypothetical protein